MSTMAVVVFCRTCNYFLKTAVQTGQTGTHGCIQCGHAMEVYVPVEKMRPDHEYSLSTSASSDTQGARSGNAGSPSPASMGEGLHPPGLSDVGQSPDWWFHDRHGLHDEAHHQAHGPLDLCVPLWDRPPTGTWPPSDGPGTDASLWVCACGYKGNRGPSHPDANGLWCHKARPSDDSNVDGGAK